jgi:hypothetical protein
MINNFYRYRKCNSNLTSNTKFSQYQRLKIIQNTVRIPSSIYLMNLSTLNTLDNTPNPQKEGLRWNQMSDRVIPHYQKKTITRLRPSSLSPGGYGVDIKHNSYNRFLNKIKGNILKRGKFTFNNNNDINVKTSIISNCNCNDNYKLINDDEIQQPIFNTMFSFYVGEFVNTFINEINDYEKSQIISFKDNNIVEVFIIKYNIYINVPIYNLSRYIEKTKCPSTSTQDEITELYKINNTDNTIKVNQLICNL